MGMDLLYIYHQLSSLLIKDASQPVKRCQSMPLDLQEHFFTPRSHCGQDHVCCTQRPIKLVEMVHLRGQQFHCHPATSAKNSEKHGILDGGFFMWAHQRMADIAGA